MNIQAQRAKLRAKVNAAEKRLRQLHAMRDWLGIEKALPDIGWPETTGERFNDQHPFRRAVRGLRQRRRLR